MLSKEAQDRLRERLNETHQWPAVYMFKFILEPDTEKLQAVLDLFPKEVEVLRKFSEGGKYVSLTVKEVMMSSDEIIKRYDKASDIQGVIVL